MRSKRVAVIFLCFMFLVAFMAVSCQRAEIPETETSTENGQEDMLKIIYEGRETLIDPEGLEELEVVEKELSIVPKEEEEEEINSRKVKGYYLEDIFEKYLDLDMKTLQGIRLSAKDGYSIEVDNEILSDNEVIIAYEVDGKPLEEWERPFRSAVSDVFEMYWVKNLVLIEVISGRVQTVTDKIVLLETRIGQLESQDYEYYDSIDKAVKADDLIFDFEDYDVSDYINVIASDGLEKNEDVNVFRSGYIKHTGDNSPAFLGEDIPKGMWIKKIYYLSYGETSYFSVKTGLGLHDTKDIEGKKSIGLAEVFEEVGMQDKETYTLEASDGYEVEIEKDMITDGYLFIDDNGNISVFFEESQKKYSVKDLLMIK